MPITTTIAGTILRTGERVTVRNYTGFDTADEHGDADRVQEANSPYSDVPAVADVSGSPNRRRERGYSFVDSEMDFLLIESHASVDGLNGSGKAAPPSEIERAEGDTYRVIRTHRPRDGSIVCFCEQVEPEP